VREFLLDIEPELWLICGLGAMWLLGLILLLVSIRRPDAEREHYADINFRGRPTNGVPDA
jgi:hypothetical protein